ncbi:Annexin [Teladorsagia circumcincta]|uniref:Annexin n=1 Tax=Teladorsagia circumcincta TaxID=45464 RepID=A0A2G9U4Q3_TELCI|nr:Annexin [Teladorsagia circumcincta]
MATIHPSASFDEDHAAEALERAMRGYGTDKQKVIDILVKCNNAQRQMGFGTDEKVLIEILASRSNEEIRAIRNTYYTTYDKSLEEAIWSDTSGDFRRMLVLLLQGSRDEYGIPQYHKAVQDAQQLLRASDKKSGQDKFDAKICIVATPLPAASIRSARAPVTILITLSSL